MAKQPSSIFISHSHLDKTFARQLALDLGALGVRVWIDDGEIKLGDSLVEKINSGINEMDYLGVVLSVNSLNSDWVRREIEIALDHEKSKKSVKVLPLLIDNCDMPGFLLGKLYADFRSKANYSTALRLLADRLGVGRSAFANETAQEAEDPESKSRRFLEIARALRSLNELERAEAFLDWSLNVAQNLQDKIKDSLVDEIAEQFGMMGLVDKSIETAAIVSDDRQYLVKRSVSKALAVAGKCDEALELARRIVDESHRNIGMENVALELARKGRISDALAVVSSLSPSSVKKLLDDCLERKSYDFLTAANLENVLDAMPRGTDYRAAALADVATASEVTGDKEAAIRYAESAAEDLVKDYQAESAYHVWAHLHFLYEKLGITQMVLEMLNKAEDATWLFENGNDANWARDWIKEKKATIASSTS